MIPLSGITTGSGGGIMQPAAYAGQVMTATYAYIEQQHLSASDAAPYVAAAKVFRFFVHSDFHALQAINILAAMALFPLLFWFALELRFPFRCQ